MRLMNSWMQSKIKPMPAPALSYTEAVRYVPETEEYAEVAALSELNNPEDLPVVWA